MKTCFTCKLRKSNKSCKYSDGKPNGDYDYCVGWKAKK